MNQLERTQKLFDAFQTVVTEAKTPNLPQSSKQTTPTTIPNVVKKSI